LLQAVDPSQRAAVVNLLDHPRLGGKGLRMWLRMLGNKRGSLPWRLPAALINVYLQDSEAVPLHDCADCGLAIPIRPHWRGYEWEPGLLYFECCPSCGGSTGLYAYWSRNSGR